MTDRCSWPSFFLHLPHPSYTQHPLVDYLYCWRNRRREYDALQARADDCGSEHCRKTPALSKQGDKPIANDDTCQRLILHDAHNHLQHPWPSCRTASSVDPRPARRSAAASVSATLKRNPLPRLSLAWLSPTQGDTTYMATNAGSKCCRDRCA